MSDYTGPDRRQRRPWSLGRRADDRKWPRFARDIWLVIITGVTLVAIWNTNDLTGRVARNQRATSSALCALRGDLQQRIKGADDYLKTHPQGFPGVPAATIRQSIDGQRRTVTALAPVPCPRATRAKHPKHR